MTHCHQRQVHCGGVNEISHFKKKKTINKHLNWYHRITNVANKIADAWYAKFEKGTLTLHIIYTIILLKSVEVYLNETATPIVASGTGHHGWAPPTHRTALT